MKIYTGTRISQGEVTVMVRTLAQDQETLNEKPLYHVDYHSPDGFEWGYGGSGPADLALSMLADHFKDEHGPVTKETIWQGDHPAVKHHQRFKKDFVAGFSKGEWVMSSEQIDAWYAGLPI
jgi:hypothetical protein